MRYTYYIYHIEGIKIGCTTDLIKRMADQGFTEWEILWQEEGDYDFGWIAGDKEIELQKEYGLPIDNSNYQISRNNRAKGYPSRFAGKSHTKESKRKTSGALKGRKKPEGHGENVSKATKGVSKSKEHVSKVRDSLRTTTDQQELEILNDWNSGMNMSQISAKHGINVGIIRRIRKNGTKYILY
jgi:hypothetical protein